MLKELKFIRSHIKGPKQNKTLLKNKIEKKEKFTTFLTFLMKGSYHFHPRKSKNL